MTRASTQTASKHSTPSTPRTSPLKRKLEKKVGTDAADGIHQLHAGHPSQTTQSRSEQRDPTKPHKAVPATPKLAPHVVAGPAIDKLAIALLSDALPDDTASAVADRLKRLLRKSPSRGRSAGFLRGRSKGDIFKRVVIQRLPSGAVVKYAMEPTKPSVKQRLQVTLNPNQMDQDDALAFRDTLKRLLAPDWKRLARSFLCTRLDVNVDVLDVDIDRLIIEFEGARSQGVFYVQIDRSGRVQTIYCGSSQSATHGVVYDQVASETSKRRFGEKPLQRPRVADDAELSFKTEGGRVRFEVRNVLEQPRPLSQLATMPTALDKFRVYELAGAALQRVDGAQLALLDSVRLRGVAGARAHFRSAKRGAAAVEALDQLLARFVASWWDPEALAHDVHEALLATPVWTMLVGNK